MATANKTRTYLQIILGVSALGWIDAFYSLWHRQKLFLNGLEGKSFCTLSKTVDCDAVALTSYSSTLGIPTAAWGMVYYSLLIILGVWAYFLVQDRKEEKIRPATCLLLTIAALGMIPTLALAVISFAVIKTLCLMCLLVYILNIVILLTAIPAYRSSPPATKGMDSFMTGLKLVPQGLWITIVALAALQLWSPAIVNGMVGGPVIDDNTIRTVIEQHFQNPVKSIPTEGAPAEGPTSAPVTIIEFSDMQCPHCAHSARTLPPLLRQYEGKVRHVFKNYPLDPACNKNVQGAGHNLACLGAKSGYCVFKSKGNEAFFEYKDKVFTNQPELTADKIRGYALESGIAASDLDTCVNDPATHEAIVDQVAQGTAAGVEGTPSIYVNGRLVDSGPNVIILKAILDRELAGK